MIKKTITNVLLLCIAFAIVLGIVLYSIASFLMIVGLDSRSSIALGFVISMIAVMTVFKLTGVLKLEVKK